MLFYCRDAHECALNTKYAPLFSKLHHFSVSPNRKPYELRICNKCDWHTIQDEEHIILNCPSPDLVQLRVQFQNLFDPLQQINDTAQALRISSTRPMPWE
jgi:hypothetical protein